MLRFVKFKEVSYKIRRVQLNSYGGCDLLTLNRNMGVPKSSEINGKTSDRDPKKSAESLKKLASLEATTCNNWSSRNCSDGKGSDDKPDDNSRLTGLSRAKRVRTAIHQAGYTVCAWFSPLVSQVREVAVVDDGKQPRGWTKYESDWSALTDEKMVQWLSVSLAAMAAEELFLGSIAPTWYSDSLGQAVDRIAASAPRLQAQWGLASVKFKGDDKTMIERTLTVTIMCRTYARTLDLIREHKSDVYKIAVRLVEGETLRAGDLIVALGARPSKGNVLKMSPVSYKPSLWSRFLVAMRDRERVGVAYHEAGHAVCAWFSPHVSQVTSATIVPSGPYRGMVRYANEGCFQTVEELYERLCVDLAGMAAEELFIGGVAPMVTTGDFKLISQRTAVVVPRLYEQLVQSRLLSGTYKKRDQMQKGLETAVICSAYGRTLDLLRDHRGQVHQVAMLLLIQKTLDSKDLTLALGKRPRPPTPKIFQF